MAKLDDCCCVTAVTICRPVAYTTRSPPTPHYTRPTIMCYCFIAIVGRDRLRTEISKLRPPSNTPSIRTETINNFQTASPVRFARGGSIATDVSGVPTRRLRARYYRGVGNYYFSSRVVSCSLPHCHDHGVIVLRQKRCTMYIHGDDTPAMTTKLINVTFV